MENTDEKRIRSEVIQHIGKSIGTVWGVCLVHGIEKDGNEEMILLSEAGEKFYVKLSDWDSLRY